ncbi:MAG: hypothetical protein K940chlam1_00899 [Candidatus Anoxychlamydiales bacterium]|nr:hypothetical protein [Candidatus Anoxychlamydiales bacterium]NGX36170.1 hypothetical protein [Candidatus Anoxychlamydiales bacterium]
MKKKYFLMILAFILVSSFSITEIFNKKTYVYKNVTGSSKNTTTWLVKRQKGDLVITKTSDYGITDIVYSPKYELKLMKFSSATENDDYKMQLDDNKLTLNGTIKGRKASKVYIMSDRWVQDFNYGLRNFLESQMSEYKFVIINPDDFTSYQMVATRKGIHKMKINDHIYNTQQIEVSLRGFRSLFWKAQIWYDLETYDLVKYRANDGPGSPMKTTILDSKK